MVYTTYLSIFGDLGGKNMEIPQMEVLLGKWMKIFDHDLLSWWHDG